MYIEAPLDYPINCSGLFILEICSISVYHLENQQNFIGTNPRNSTLPRDEREPNVQRKLDFCVSQYGPVYPRMFVLLG